MSVKFIKHILQRLKNRNISKEEILQILNNPDEIKKDSYGNLIAQKIYAKYILSVFYYHDKNSKIVITAYKSSKINKFL